MTEVTLESLSSRLNAWLFEEALPLWWQSGADRERGGFHELLALDGVAPSAPRRARVQARQSYSYAKAGDMGWTGPWRQAAPHGLDYLISKFRSPDSEFSTLVSIDGTVLDPSTLLYDQAFALLAAAEIVNVLPERSDLRDMAHGLVRRIAAKRRHPAGGFSESSHRPFQANAHMHFLEAMLSWRDVESGVIWDELADEIVALCLSHFIDPHGGFLREFFDASWQPAADSGGHIVEPGHQFEWAWLLERWSRLHRDTGAHQAAMGLYESGCRGVDRDRDAAIDELSDDFLVTRGRARLWPQTERMKAALFLSQTAPDGRRRELLGEGLRAGKCLLRYLATPKPGLWRDKLDVDGTFAVEPAPASSFYHIVCGIDVLNAVLAPR
ncbi:MAG: AGE family epimerase/isomerase [Alphaproteobacteria bacterium]|nr:AGE family epimerase/isomerase [Alphaproteobacteria bacterium]